MRHSEKGLYQALEKILRKARKPMDCVELYDIREVRDFAATPNRVSDYLGNMWRKGEVKRLPGPSTEHSGARWSYQWKDRLPAGVGIEYEPRLLVDRPAVVVTEEGSTMTLTMPNLIITIRQTNTATR
jgi:hypothetical protein